MQTNVQNTDSEIFLSSIEQKFFKGDVTLPNHSLVRIISGQMRVIHANHDYIFKAGDTFLFPKDQLATVIKSGKDDCPYKSVVMNINTELLKNIYINANIDKKASDTRAIRTFGSHPLLESYFASLIPYFDLTHRLPNELSTIKVHEIIVILRALDKGIDGILSDFSDPGKINLKEYMERNFMFNLPLEKFSYLAGRSLTTFKKDFKKTFHMTPQKWLVQKRLDLAHFLISEKHRKPIEVYHEAGFENLSHFSFAFKRKFGYPPSTLLKHNKNTK